MSEIMAGIRGILSAAWNFLMNTTIPNTDIAYGVFFVGLAMIGLGFRFLSLAIGYNIGEVDPDTIRSISSGFGGRSRSTRYRSSDARKNDVR